MELVGLDGCLADATVKVVVWVPFWVFCQVAEEVATIEDLVVSQPRETRQ